MTVFMKILKLRHGRNARNMDQKSARIKLIIEREESQRGNFVYPGIDTIARIEVDGQRVGKVDYGINPLGDRLYINIIEVRAGFRFRGYALATLWQLWQLQQMPIVPLDQRGNSTLFWAKARKRFAQAGARLEQELRVSELDLAKQRWAHLIPESVADISIRKYWKRVASEHAAGRPVGPGIK